MAFQITGSSEALLTNVAWERSFFTMPSHVVREISEPGEPLLTNVTFMILLLCTMKNYMLFQVVRLSERFVADSAFVGLFLGVNFFMPGQILWQEEAQFTKLTLV